MREAHDFSRGSSHEALAYYHNNPKEMREVETHHREAVEEASVIVDAS